MAYAWACDPVTRAASLSPESISWPEHEAWFSTKLRDPHSDVFIVTTDDLNPLGIVRFEGEVISVSIAAQHRGQGFGATAISLGCREFFRTRADAARVIAFIKPENEASIRAFDAAGFKPGGKHIERGVEVLRFELTRSETSSR